MFVLAFEDYLPPSNNGLIVRAGAVLARFGNGQYLQRYSFGVEQRSLLSYRLWFEIDFFRVEIGSHYIADCLALVKEDVPPIYTYGKHS